MQPAFSVSAKEHISHLLVTFFFVSSKREGLEALIGSGMDYSPIEFLDTGRITSIAFQLERLSARLLFGFDESTNELVNN